MRLLWCQLYSTYGAHPAQQVHPVWRQGAGSRCPTSLSSWSGSQSLEPSSLSTRCMMGSCASLYGLSLDGISSTVGMTLSYVLRM